MTRTFTIINDSTTDGPKNMVFTTNFNNPTVIMDVYASILINDTSQSPKYQTTSSLANPGAGTSFRIVFAITNYSILTEAQRNEQLNYVATVTDSNGANVTSSSIEGSLSGRIISSNGILSASGSMTQTFMYRCITTATDTFRFTIGNVTTTLRLNTIS